MHSWSHVLYQNVKIIFVLYAILFNNFCIYMYGSLQINYFSTIALWAIQIEFSIARLKF